MAVPPESPASPDGNWREGLRSLWHLSRHLTARADDNHAAPMRRSRRTDMSPYHPAALRARVRFLAYHRIKPHVPPLVRAPVNSFEFHRCPVNSFEFHRCRRTPQAGHLTLSLGRGQCIARGECPSFTVRTTRVSNPVRYPHLRASTSVADWRAAFAIGVLRDIYAFHRYTTNSARRDRTQDSQFQPRTGVEPRLLTADLRVRLRSL